jgi:transketolase
MGKSLEIKNEKFSTRDGFGAGLLELAKKNKNIVVLTANLAESTRVLEFKEKFPERFFDVGVAEQNLAGIAAGLALEGKIPFITSFAVFSPGRNWEQIRVSICYNQANVKIIGCHAGLVTGSDGATHQALEDIALMRVLPNMTVVVPADYYEAKKAVKAIADIKGPVYLRLTRPNFSNVTSEKAPFKIGQARVLKTGKDATLIACGEMVAESLRAAELLKKQGFEIEVINCHTIKPLDKKTILTSAKKTGYVITCEDHQIVGGLGGAVAELLSQKLPTPLTIIGVNDKFGQSGSAEELLNAYGLNASNIVNRVLTSLRATAAGALKKKLTS